MESEIIHVVQLRVMKLLPVSTEYEFELSIKNLQFIQTPNKTIVPYDDCSKDYFCLVPVASQSPFIAIIIGLIILRFV